MAFQILGIQRGYNVVVASVSPWPGVDVMGSAPLQTLLIPGDEIAVRRFGRAGCLTPCIFHMLDHSSVDFGHVYGKHHASRGSLSFSHDETGPLRYNRCCC